ncbi:MAG: sigma-70 family RNA polymerase sigma factor [Planctomycetaceae bacterium]|nr:sigma-70 family RNA polymerase sigma factor [Planctomycetaceae bacterium]
MTADESQDERIPTGGSTSRSLLADAKQAVPAAWERLVRLYAPLVASWCRRWGVDEQDVGDLLQDVFSAVAGHLDRFRKERPTDTFRGWLLTIARNKVRDHFRRRAAEPAAAGGSEAALRLQQILDPSAQNESCDVTNDMADVVVLDELLRKALESIRGEFHERTWQAFWGVVVEGRTAADVAADLDMKPGTVRVSKSRVLLRLRPPDLAEFALAPSLDWRAVLRR